MPRNEYPPASAIDNATARVPADAKTKSTPIRDGQRALSFNKKSAKASEKRLGRAPCNEAEWQILAEAAVDISELLLGEGIHKINSMQDRVRLAVKKAESIRKLAQQSDYDRLVRELPANTLPKITPGALLRWLDAEFKDIVDAVFFVDSAEEFAKLLRTFAQGIACNFFGDKVRVTVKVNGAARKQKRLTTSNQVMRTPEPDPAKSAGQSAFLGTTAEMQPLRTLALHEPDGKI